MLKFWQLNFLNWFFPSLLICHSFFGGVGTGGMSGTGDNDNSNTDNSTTTTTTNEDNSVNVQDGQVLGAGSVLAEELGSYSSNSGNVSITGGTFENLSMFPSQAADVVNKAIGALESVTAKNLQLYTDKNLLSDLKEGLNFDDIKAALSKPPVFLSLLGVGFGGLFFVYRKRGK